MPIYACTLIKARTQRAAQAAVDAAKIPEVGMMFPTIGRADLVTFLRADDLQSLGDVLLHHFQPNKIIAHITTLVFIGEIVSMKWAGCAAKSRVNACVLIDITAGNLVRVGQRVGELDEIVFVAPTAGEVDIVAMVQTADMPALGQAVSKLQAIDGVRKTETLIALGAFTLHHWALKETVNDCTDHPP